ncbi:MAG TPA: glycosyltransferase [Candidatus Sulfotelmatobacter sp.]|nr:glycosyltransferase [Candidatus Sulfotelmatobacter sp.]
MLEFVKFASNITLDDYAAVPQLTGAVHNLRSAAEVLLPEFRCRTVLMLNSTARGGGVAEMLPRVVQTLNELGVTTQWAAMKVAQPEFFRLTKRLHNLIHGRGDPALNADDKRLYEEVSHGVADALRPHLKSGDVLVIHDPQPLGVAAIIKSTLDVYVFWRCHIGVDFATPATRAAWEFLKPYAEACDHSVFSAPEYVPYYLAGRSSVIYPGIDPLSHKNRHLTPHKLTGVLCNAGLAKEFEPVLTMPFSHPATRLQPDGTFGPAVLPDEIGFLYRTIVAQISRWDRLKGFGPLMAGFVRLKQKLRETKLPLVGRDRRRIEIVRLVLAGPEPNSVKDDPESQEVLEELRQAYRHLEPEFQRDIALLSLPMASQKENELIVNAIQRCASIVVQNSLEEGFGLTATEAMWKGTPVLGTEACGLRQQIRDGIDGRLIRNPEDPGEIADRLDEMLSDYPGRERMSRNAQRRVYLEFLVFVQVEHAMRVVARCIQQNERQEAA